MLENQLETLYTTNKYRYENLKLDTTDLCIEPKPILKIQDNKFKCCDSFDVCLSKTKSKFLRSFDNKPNNFSEQLLSHNDAPSIIIDMPQKQIKIELPNNLKEYTITSNTNIEKCNKLSLLIPNYIIIDNDIYNNSKLLGCGAYGQVYEYINKNGRKYSMKIILNKNDDDIINGNYLRTVQTCKEYIIKYYVIQNKIPIIHEQYLLMEYYDGNLNDLMIFRTFTHKTRLKLITHIINACLCFQRSGLYYMDIKPANILYKYISLNNIVCVFSDIGSFYRYDTDKKCSITFTRPDFKDTDIYKKDFEANLIWGLLVLFMSFYCVNSIIKDCFYDNSNWFERQNKHKIFGWITDARIRKYMSDKISTLVNIPATIEQLYNEFLTLYSSI